MNEKQQSEMSAAGRRSFLPMQAVPVDRATTGGSAATGTGVEPSFGFGDIWDVVKTVAPTVLRAL